MADAAEIIKPWGDYHTPGVNEDVVEILEAALEAAKAGECVALGLVMIMPNGFTRTRGLKGSRGFGEIVGAVSALHHDLICAWKDQENG